MWNSDKPKGLLHIHFMFGRICVVLFSRYEDHISTSNNENMQSVIISNFQTKKAQQMNHSNCCDHSGVILSSVGIFSLSLKPRLVSSVTTVEGVALP